MEEFLRAMGIIALFVIGFGIYAGCLILFTSHNISQISWKCTYRSSESGECVQYTFKPNDKEKEQPHDQ